MSSIFGKCTGFGHRKAGGTVAERKYMRRRLVQAMVKKLKADGTYDKIFAKWFK